MPGRRGGRTRRTASTRRRAAPTRRTATRRTTRSTARRSTPTRRTVNRAARTNTVKRGANIARTNNRNARRRAAQKRAAAQNRRPRPNVRPAASPRKVMPRRKAARPVARPRAASGLGLAAAGVAAAGTLMLLNTNNIPEAYVTDVNSLQGELNSIQDKVSLNDIQEDIAKLDKDLSHALNLLESAREKGYYYESDLEEIALAAMNSWEEVKQPIEADIERHSRLLEQNLPSLNTSIQSLNNSLAGNAGAKAIQNLNTEVDRVMDAIEDAEREIESVYSDIESKVYTLTSRLTTIHWMLTQLDEAGFEFEGDEELVRAVKCRWDQDGDDDPEGILFLSNQRLLFERKEKVATKKILFVTTAKELVQEVLIDQKLTAIEETKSKNKGLFGQKDFVEIKFASAQPGTVLFHITGQDSDAWIRLIQDAKTGKIADDRTTGSGISFADLTGSVTTADIVELQQEVNDLQDEMMLKECQAEISELENDLMSLDRDLQELRAEGYAVEKSLEADITVLASQWDQIKERATKTLDYQTSLLGEQMKTIQEKISKLAGMTGNLAAARPLFVELKSMIASAEAQSEAAEETVLDQYDEFADEVETLSAHLDWVEWMLEAISTASFQLLATESGVAAVEAIWQRPSLEPENGILYITDQRLLWEDRVGDYELKIDVPVSGVQTVVFSEEEETRIDILTFDVGSNGPTPKLVLKLAQEVGEEWVKMVGRAKAGDYVSDRAVEVDQAELDRIRNAPQSCSACGGVFTAPVLRGQTEIICEFCGTPTRI